MQRGRRYVVVVIGSALCAACSSPSPAAAPPPPPATTAAAATSAAPTSTPFATAAPLAEIVDWPNQLENVDAAKFSTPTVIDNTWSPLKPGTQFTYEGVSEQDGERTPKRFIQTVTDLTKTINGVRTVVVWDQDFQDGQLAEAEIALFAQSDTRDIWAFGEYPEVYEQGKIVETPTWIAGIAGSRAGIAIKETPVLGGPSYSQGWGPTVPWTDRARVAQVGVMDCVPQGCYENGIVTEEFNREEPGAIQLKYYAPGLGNTRVSFTGADATRETLELISVTQLDPAALADARTKVLALEESGYQRSRSVYALTPRIEQLPPGN
jgi:hypothetical protein